MNEKRLKDAAAWWKLETESSPSEQNARLLAIFEWLVDASPSEREEWFDGIGGFDADMARAILEGFADDAPEDAVEVPTGMSQ